MQEYCRACAPFGARPVPVRDQDKIVKWIRSTQHLVTAIEGRADLMVVVEGVRIVAPEIAVSDRSRPSAGLRHPVGPVETADDSVRSAWRGPVPLALVQGRATAPYRTGKQATEKAKAFGSENKIVAGHAVEPSDVASALERARPSPGLGRRLR